MSVERGVSYRERAAGCYSVLPFSLALARTPLALHICISKTTCSRVDGNLTLFWLQVVIELPYVFVQTCVYSVRAAVPALLDLLWHQLLETVSYQECALQVLTYSMIQFVWTPAKFWLYFVYMYETLLYFTFFGMASVCVCPSLDLAAVLSSNFYATANLFAGKPPARLNLSCFDFSCACQAWRVVLTLALRTRLPDPAAPGAAVVGLGVLHRPGAVDAVWAGGLAAERRDVAAHAGGRHAPARQCIPFPVLLVQAFVLGRGRRHLGGLRAGFCAGDCARAQAAQLPAPLSAHVFLF